MVAKRGTANRYTGMSSPGDREVAQLQENVRILQRQVDTLASATAPTFDEYDDTFLKSQISDLQRQIDAVNQRIDELTLDDGGGGTTTQPATITSYSGGSDTHTVSIFGNGYGETATETGVELDSINNLAANEELQVGRQLWVLTAGDERIGIINGIL